MAQKQVLLPAIILFLFCSAVFAQTKILNGEITDNVQSASDPSMSHAIYLPSTYTSTKRWPILFCFDPRSQGKVPAELFREGAERLGWIIFSSNNFRSDDPHFNNLDVLNAMWSDAHRWFSLDEQRIYATGFSGGSRISWGMGYIYPKSVAGVIGVGAGRHEAKPPSKDTTFVWYGMSGVVDYNYLEMRQLGRELHILGIPSRVAFYEGPHSWPPTDEYCSKAMDWMELQAMKRNRRPRDAAWIQQQFDAKLEEAQKLEATDPFEAWKKYTELQEDYTGLIDTTETSKSVARLADSEVIKKILQQEKELEEEEQKYMDKYVVVLGPLRNAPEIPSLGKLKSDLKLTMLKNEIKDQGDTPEGRMYTRLQTKIYVQVEFYFPQYFLDRKEPDRALVSLKLAEEIHEEDPYVFYHMALAYAQKKDKKKVFENLSKSIDLGLKRKKLLAEEKEFDGVKDDPQFQQLLARLPGS